MAIEWTFPLIIGVVALLALIWGLMNKNKKGKNVSADNAMKGGAVVLVLVLLFGGINLGGMFAGLTAAPAVPGTPGYVAPGIACEEKYYSTLTVGTMVYASNSYTTATGTAKIYASGVDPTSSNSNPKDTVTVTSGVGSTTNSLLKSCTMYSVVFDGSTTYYDAYWNDNSGEQVLPYVSTDSAAITASIDFSKIITVATIDDPIDESSVTGVVNGQTVNNSITLNASEIQSANTGAPADDDALIYSTGNGDGQFYLDLAIGFSGGNKAVKDPVLCFVNDLTNPFEGNEFSSVTGQLRTGTDFGIPSSITNYVNNADCVPLGSFVNGGASGTYRITFNVDESLLTAGGDKMYIYIDDLSKHLGQDILKGTKAAASDAVTLYTKA